MAQNYWWSGQEEEPGMFTFYFKHHFSTEPPQNHSPEPVTPKKPKSYRSKTIKSERSLKARTRYLNEQKGKEYHSVSKFAEAKEVTLPHQQPLHQSFRQRTTSQLGKSSRQSDNQSDKDRYSPVKTQNMNNFFKFDISRHRQKLFIFKGRAEVWKEQIRKYREEEERKLERGQRKKARKDSLWILKNSMRVTQQEPLNINPDRLSPYKSKIKVETTLRRNQPATIVDFPLSLPQSKDRTEKRLLKLLQGRARQTTHRQKFLMTETDEY